MGAAHGKCFLMVAPFAQEEEAERLREEEERRKAEEAERKKAEKKERRAEMKRQGLLLTGKAKKEAERLAAMREQFLKQTGAELVDGAGKTNITFTSLCMLRRPMQTINPVLRSCSVLCEL